jgi:antitoxin HicB
MLEYPAKIKYNKIDDVFEVSFPDVKGCYTYGKTLEEAQKFAKEALTGWLEVAFEENMKIPVTSKSAGKGIYYISPEPNVAFAILLRKEREEKHLSQKQIAEKLSVSYQAYQRLENPRRANPSLKTISKLEKILEKSLVHI